MTVKELIELLNDKDDYVVEDAIGQLELKGADALEPLMDALSHRKKNVRLHAATLLGAINDEKAIPSLIETLKDSDEKLSLFILDCFRAALNHLRGLIHLNYDFNTVLMDCNVCPFLPIKIALLLVFNVTL